MVTWGHALERQGSKSALHPPRQKVLCRKETGHFRDNPRRRTPSDSWVRVCLFSVSRESTRFVVWRTLVRPAPVQLHVAVSLETSKFPKFWLRMFGVVKRRSGSGRNPPPPNIASPNVPWTVGIQIPFAESKSDEE
jgi:hypothetical protein